MSRLCCRVADIEQILLGSYQERRLYWASRVLNRGALPVHFYVEKRASRLENHSKFFGCEHALLIGTPEYLIRVFSATFPPIFRNVGGAISPLSRSSIPAHTYITTQDHNNCNHSTRCSRHHLNSNQFKCKFENSTEFDEKLVKV